MNKLDWFDWCDDVVELAIRDLWGTDDARGIANSIGHLHEQGDTPEEAYRKYQEGEV